MALGICGLPQIEPLISSLGKTIFPRMRTVVSTWGFDLDQGQRTKDFGEFDGLDQYIKANPGVFDFTLADSGLSFPVWPLKNGHGPGGLPLLNFPEISMHFREPWGGTGANPMPARFQGLWQPVSKIVTAACLIPRESTKT